MLARVHDTDAQVLDALYAKPSVVNPILSRDSAVYLDNLAASICIPDSKPSRSVLRAHVTFLASNFCPTVEPQIQAEVFHKILFPFLLFSKPRQKTAEAVWEIVVQSEVQHGRAIFELLGGCAETWKLEQGKESADIVETMVHLNLALVSKIAGQVI